MPGAELLDRPRPPLPRAARGRRLLPRADGGPRVCPPGPQRALRGAQAGGDAPPGTEATAEERGAVAWPYGAPDLAARAAKEFPEGFDVVFDPFGGSRKGAFASLLKPGGTLVGMGYGGSSAIGYFANCLAYGMPVRGRRYFGIGTLARRDPKALSNILGELEGIIAEGKIRPRVAGVAGKLVIRLKG